MAEADASDTRPISLFYSYAHEDEELRARLEKHLRFLRRSNLIVEWHDRNIDAGDDWAREIDRNLVSADIILLLVSAGFIASDYCWGEEVTKALARHDRGEARVIPVILRPCRWLSTRLGRLQGLPREGRAVTLWPNVDEAFDDVAAGIERVVGELRERREDAARGSIPSAETFGTPTISRSPTGLTVTQTPAPPDKGLADFQVFRDVAAPWCPELVVIPAGSFLMGSPLNEGGASTTKARSTT